MTDRTTKLQRLEICPFNIGDLVTVSPSFRYAAEWPGRYIVTALRWEYQLMGGINIAIASEADLGAGYGDADGFAPADLVLETARAAPGHAIGPASQPRINPRTDQLPGRDPLNALPDFDHD